MGSKAQMGHGRWGCGRPRSGKRCPKAGARAPTPTCSMNTASLSEPVACRCSTSCLRYGRKSEKVDTCRPRAGVKAWGAGHGHWDRGGNARLPGVQGSADTDGLGGVLVFGVHPTFP